ncbi:MAG: hypothetical protein JJW00_07595 [Sulfurimonas sp.]|nr:hypothetical protein [Sulfurimonas sp.]
MIKLIILLTILNISHTFALDELKKSTSLTTVNKEHRTTKQIQEYEISKSIMPYIEKNYIFKQPKEEYMIVFQESKLSKKFARIDAVLVYKNGEFIDGEYLPDMVFALCIEKIDDKWKIVYDLSRTDLPSANELELIKKEFPSNFPKKLLSKFWYESI